ncbi:hypothetical protein D9611_000227 [Ephemerocybe angulata]|uniref:N2227-domain-containing protein n=1 Tax=Ephemerocybe angulata TaxID=980116 RepID=A0A8H5BMM9_9AGAR|nr:hypothetical protein D9611_000227 [Tulosesus angulatus]
MTTATFDVVLGCLFPLALLLVGYRLRDNFFSRSELYGLLFPSTASPTPATIYSRVRAYHSYLQYLKLSYNDVQRMRSSYASLGRGHKGLGYRIGYPQKLERLWEVTSMNATLAEEIADLAVNEYAELKHTARVQATAADLARVRESLKHFVRDWSQAGADERARTFAPVLDLLRLVDPAQRSQQRVLVPGAGLGRLAWEIAQLGFDTTANELSYFMVLAFRFLLSAEATQKAEQHKIRPYAHWFSHQKSNENLFRSVSFPDVVPRLGPNFHLLEGDFLKLPHPTAPGFPSNFWSQSKTETGQQTKPAFEPGGFDYVVTLFFIDTSFNVLETMEQIFALLKPGGSWVNHGPLLWPGGGQCKLELSLEEVLAAAAEVGFVLERHEDGHPEAQRSVECEYTTDPLAMMRWAYKTEFWVAKKPLL